MKTFFKIFIVFSLILGLGSCDDFLDLKPYGPPTDGLFWETENDALRAADGLYFCLGDDGIVGRGFMYFYNCSDDIVTGRTNEGADAVKNFIKHEGPDVKENWPKMYQMIKRANDIILHVPSMNIPEGTKNRVLGQAYFYRAWAYLWLAPYYGDDGLNGGIPIVKAMESKDIKDYVDLPRPSSVRENYALIIEDFIKASELLPTMEEWGTSEYGRPHKHAAWGYVARTALYDAQYDDKSYQTVITYCDKVIDTNTYDLVSDFSTLFTEQNNFGEEYLFSFVSNEIAGSILPGVMLENKGWGQYNGWGYFMPTIELVEAYELNDKRLPVTILQPGDKFTFLGKEKLYYSNASSSGIQFNKYMSPFTPENAVGKTINTNGDYPTTRLDIPLMRFADILLMKSEALIWTGQNGDAPLNLVRARAGLTPKTNAKKEDLMNERRCEFAGEYTNRMIDLLRWGVAKDYVEKPLHGYTVALKEDVKTPTSKDDLIIEKKVAHKARTFNPQINHVFPIPQSEIDKGGLKQNSGY